MIHEVVKIGQRHGKMLRILPAIVVLLAHCSAFSTPVLDQQQETQSGAAMYGLQQSVAQTFTAGYSLQLDHVEVEMYGTGTPAYPTTVEIRATVSGAPTGAALGSVFAPAGFAWGWDSIDFQSQNVLLTAGSKYAIVFYNDDPNFLDVPSNGVRVAWNADAYTAGELWIDEGAGWEIYTDWPGEGDMAFRTYVVAEPMALSLVALCGLALIRRKK